ncbi:MAG: hypothetical protein MZV63_30580 [Marinilabiliales bacterium]|nr:hypothetical protein [Marinilabiliales bacterium]
MTGMFITSTEMGCIYKLTTIPSPKRFLPILSVQAIYTVELPEDFQKLARLCHGEFRLLGVDMGELQAISTLSLKIH